MAKIIRFFIVLRVVMEKCRFLLCLFAAFLVVACGGSEAEIPECSESLSFPCTDAASGLSWSAKAMHPKNWDDALFYCENLEENGVKNWKLPNIDELRTLIKDCDGTVSGGGCKVSSDRGCLSYDSCWSTFCLCKAGEGGKYSKFGDSGGLWSSSEAGDEGAWYINFYEAKIIDDYKESSYAVRCVK